MIMTKALPAFLVMLCVQTSRIEAIWCYLCDSSSTGVATTIPSGNQRQPDCSSSDPTLLEKFVYNCDKYSTLFNSCESAFGFAADGKTVTRTYRDCINDQGKSNIRLKGTGDCQPYSYPPGLQKACACTGDRCNNENGVVTYNGTEQAAINGSSVAMIMDTLKAYAAKVAADKAAQAALAAARTNTNMAGWFGSRNGSMNRGGRPGGMAISINISSD